MASLSRIARILSAATLCTLALAGPHARAQTTASPPVGYGDWALECRDGIDADGAERCRLFQNIVLHTSGKRVLTISIARGGANKPFIASVTAPLGILLAPGLLVQVNDRTVVRFPLQRCNVNGCLGQFAVTEAVAKTLADGGEAGVVFRQPNGQLARVRFSLDGFGAGFAALREG